MNLIALQRTGSARLAPVVRWLGCFGFFKLVQGLAVFLAFPFGGGAFHAMFAYSQVGRPSVALAFAGYVFLGCLISNVLLQFFAADVPWWGLALIGAFASFVAWGEVTSWPYEVSAEFRSMAATVAWCLPALCVLSSLLVHRICARYAKAENG